MEMLRLLAARYSEEAGKAYAAGRDQDAAAYRAAAKLITDISEKLPILPKNDGPTYRASVSKRAR